MLVDLKFQAIIMIYQRPGSVRLLHCDIYTRRVIREFHHFMKFGKNFLIANVTIDTVEMKGIRDLNWNMK